MTPTPTVQAAINDGFARHDLSPVSPEASAYEQGYLDCWATVPTSLWKCVATVSYTDDDNWNHTRDLPTFYVQAVSEANAKAIALDVIAAPSTWAVFMTAVPA